MEISILISFMDFASSRFKKFYFLRINLSLRAERSNPLLVKGLLRSARNDYK